MSSSTSTHALSLKNQLISGQPLIATLMMDNILDVPPHELRLILKQTWVFLAPLSLEIQVNTQKWEPG